jgi:hypothetical protein
VERERRTLQGHHEPALALDHLRDHVVDQPVLVPELLCLKLRAVVTLVDLLEDVLEPAVVLFEDRVLRAHVQGQLLEERHLEAGVRKAADRVVRVVLRVRDAGPREFVDLDALRLAALGRVDELERALAGDQAVGGAVLVAKGVAADDDGLGPAGDEAGDVGDDDGLAEDGASAVCVSNETKLEV